MLSGYAQRCNKPAYETAEVWKNFVIEEIPDPEEPEEPGGIEDIPLQPSFDTRKVLLDGALYILRPDGSIFNAQGAEVR